MEQWDRIKTALAVAKAESFSKAGKDLGLTQSCVSRHIRALEGELGEVLFIRDAHFVKPTDAGKGLVQAFSDPFRTLEQAWSRILEKKHGIRGKLAVGCLPEIGRSIFFGAMLEFQRLHPAIRLEVDYAESGAVLDRIKDGILQFGIIGHAPERELLQSHHLMDEETVLVAGKNAPTDIGGRPDPIPFVTYRADDLLLFHYMKKFQKKLGIKTYEEKVTVNAHQSIIDTLLTFPYYAAIPLHRIRNELSTGVLAKVSQLSLKSGIYLVSAVTHEHGAREQAFRQFMLQDWKKRSRSQTPP